jgi:hypothetical protein
MAVATVEVAQVMVVAQVAAAAAGLCNPKITQKCGFLATFFWLTNKFHFAIILV